MKKLLLFLFLLSFVLGIKGVSGADLLFEASLNNGQNGDSQAFNTMNPNHEATSHVLSIVNSIPDWCYYSDLYGAGWVNIYYPTEQPTFITNNLWVYLIGEAFISPTWWHCCNGTAEELTGVKVTCQNCTTGVYEEAYQTVEIGWLVPLYDHEWSCSVDLLEGDNFIAVTASDPSGNWGRAVIKVTHIVESLPLPPSSLTTKATSSSSIILGWKDNSNNEEGFKIYRQEGACASNSWAHIATKGANVKTHTNTGLTANTTYSYRVRAYNRVGNSSYSNCASTKTALSGTPKAPTNLDATSISANQIKLIWTDNSTDEKSFKIYRKAGAGSPILLTTKGANIVSHTDNNAPKNTTSTTYSYYIQACNSSGCSPKTNTAIIPYRPTNLLATPVSASRINLKWTDKSNNETGFQIEKKSGGCSSTNPWSRIAAVGKNIKSYSNTGQSSGKTYSYRVRAYYRSSSQPYAYGYSSYSNCKTATTP